VFEVDPTEFAEILPEADRVSRPEIFMGRPFLALFWASKKVQGILNRMPLRE
jgi:hypothetical protein